jgi:hypothetical protein
LQKDNSGRRKEEVADRIHEQHIGNTKEEAYDRGKHQKREENGFAT